MVRGYIDLARLYTFTRQAVFFVIRAKRNLAYRQRASRGVDKTTGVRSDQRFVLCGPITSKEYPDALRRISFFDSRIEEAIGLPEQLMGALANCYSVIQVRICIFYNTLPSVAASPAARSPDFRKKGSDECHSFSGSLSGAAVSGALSKPSACRLGPVPGSAGDPNERARILCADVDGDHRGGVPRALRVHRGVGGSLHRTPPRTVLGARRGGLPQV